jgi:hypothetical protein
MKIQKLFNSMLAALLVLLPLATMPAPAIAQGNAQPSVLSYVAGKFVARNYMWRNAIHVNGGGSIASGSSISIPLRDPVVKLADGRTINPYFPNVRVTIGAGAIAETVTITSASGCYLTAAPGSCTIVVTTVNQHGNSEPVTSGSVGLDEAILDAASGGTGNPSPNAQYGGVVAVDATWRAFGGTDTILNATSVIFPNVSIEDDSKAAVIYWNVTPATTTLQAAPTALTAAAACVAAGAQFCSDASVAGSASWGSTAYGCFTLVDIMGNESPCSSTINFTSVASKAVDMGYPAAVTNNIVGWKPYTSVSGGTYALAYSWPLLTQPTVLQAVPLSASVCTLTVLETVTPACAIGNTTYGQAVSTTGAGTLFAGGAQFTSYPVVTNTLAPEIGSASATAYNPSEEAHATYKYAPGARLTANVQSSHFVFPITAAPQTAVGEVSATFPLPASFMNYVGRTVEVCGLIAKTSTTADTIDTIQLWWDAEGSNVTAGTPVELSSINITEGTALAAAANFHFCQQVSTTVASASATGGTITPGVGYATVSQVSAGANPSSGSSSLVAGVGSLNLALPAHLTVLFTHTTGTDGAGSKLYGATLRVIN